jgi:hypothetical protein
VQLAANRAAFRNKSPEVRIFLAVFVIAAITTTVLGMGGPLAFPAIRESLGLVPADGSGTEQWGELRWVHVASRVRASRTTDSDIVGRLEPGDSVRVDFAGAGWYAVFPAEAGSRTENKAIGYVFGRLLKQERPREGSGSSGAGG